MHEGRKSNWYEFETLGVMKENGKVLGVTSRLRYQEVHLFKFRNESARSKQSTELNFRPSKTSIMQLFCYLRKNLRHRCFTGSQIRCKCSEVYRNDARRVSSSWFRASQNNSSNLRWPLGMFFCMLSCLWHVFLESSTLYHNQNCCCCSSSFGIVVVA